MVAVGDGIELVDKLGMGRGGAVTQSVEPVFALSSVRWHLFHFDGFLLLDFGARCTG